MAVAAFVSAGGAACTRRMVACTTVGVDDVIEERFVMVNVVVRSVIRRREFLDRPETLFIVNMETVVGESDCLDL